jgi:hypothetical protein
MVTVGIFIAGVATGWVVRTSVDSSRTLAVKLISGFYGVVDRASRAVSMEREHLEDLLAEARAHHEASRGTRPRTAANDQVGGGARVAATRPTVVSASAPSVQDRAA